MSKSTKKTKPAAKAAPKRPGETKPAATAGHERVEKDDLCVFAIRLSIAERDLIHRAAGPGKASRYVRALAVAAAGGDEAGVLRLLGGPAPDIS